MRIRTILSGLLPLAFPLAVSAQQLPAPTATLAPRSLGAAVMLGTTTYRNDALHGVVGARLSLEHRGWGVLALAEAGNTGYESRAFGAAATRRLLGGGGFSLGLLVGGSYYSEEGPTGIRRSAPALLAGLEARQRLGPLSVYLSATSYSGLYSGDDVSERFRFDVPRIRAGVGY